jgi:uncharacterized protein
LKYLFNLVVLLSLSLQSCNSQNKLPENSSGIQISKGRSDSLSKSVPQARGFINDFAQIFTGAEIKTLDSLVSAYEKASTVEISVATVNSTMVKNQDFEDYTLVMFRTWGVGKKEKNNGILIVIAPDLRRVRIQNGYGIEKILTKDETKEVINSVIIPHFRESEFCSGTKEGILAIIKKLQQNGL